MIAAGQWQPVILESELPGGKLPETARERELVARALRPPPPTCLQAGRPLATQQLQIHGCNTMHRQRLRQHAALVARAAWLKQSRCRFRGDSGKRRNPRLMRSGVAGPGPHSSFSSQFSVARGAFWSRWSRDLLGRFGWEEMSSALSLSGHDFARA